MSTWRWQPARGSAIDPEEPLASGPVFVTLDEAYDLAESWWDAGARRVSIKLYVPENLGPGLADSRDRDHVEWVCGRERWRANEAKAVAEGRA
jgi:hypothetical protein